MIGTAVVVVANLAVARERGCGVNGRHQANASIAFWWPGSGMERLQAFGQVGVVIVDSDAQRFLSQAHRAAIQAHLVRGGAALVGQL